MNAIHIDAVTSRITMSCFGTQFRLRIEKDNEYNPGRLFMQVIYNAPCTKTGEVKEWHGRKYYLSSYMLMDEIVKTAYVAFESCVKHEIMEGFKVDGKVLFNPHVHFEELLKISDKEVQRSPQN